ncbi:MAG: ATP phosphoribosyltransferase regulatory subunit, partial [Coriobacteriia bacterium]|nr:ATP phosphoribosyltransferase regulatory subunit [Coriobacteriia bacterium]
MQDFLPADMRLRESIIAMIKESYARHGFMQIETPVMEHLCNLQSKQGGDNEKLIFQVMKRGRDLEKGVRKVRECEECCAAAIEREECSDSGLRYDLTLPLSRYYANNKEELPNPFKALQIGNVWRADNPQKGRFRQFVQCDIDILGDDSTLAEIELVSATSDMLKRILAPTDITGLTVHVNDRSILRAAALKAGFPEESVGSVLITLDKFDKIGFDGVEAELLQNGFDANVVSGYVALYRDAAEGVDCASFCAGFDGYLDEGVARSLDEIVTCSRAMVGEGVTIKFDPTLVRGMGYYTGPIFEVTVDGYGFSIAGGGRYDKMIGNFSGEDVCAVGFSIGFERIITILRDFGVVAPLAEGGATVFLIDKKVPQEKKMDVLVQARDLRAQGKTASVQPLKKNAKRQIAALEAEGFTDFVKVYAD